MIEGEYFILRILTVLVMPFPSLLWAIMNITDGLQTGTKILLPLVGLPPFPFLCRGLSSHIGNKCLLGNWCQALVQGDKVAEIGCRLWFSHCTDEETDSGNQTAHCSSGDKQWCQDLSPGLSDYKSESFLLQYSPLLHLYHLIPLPSTFHVEICPFTSRNSPSWIGCKETSLYTDLQLVKIYPNHKCPHILPTSKSHFYTHFHDTVVCCGFLFFFFFFRVSQFLKNILPSGLGVGKSNSYYIYTVNGFRW